ncbi:MAG: toll/interleukin-1 receptor domain-containing protein [Phycisphaerales bacterium]
MPEKTMNSEAVSHAIEKPEVFISHAASDAAFASAIENEIRRTFANGVDVFCTSSPGAIRPGSDWLAEVEGRLKRCKAVIVVVTPVSIERPWLWFEIGATWANGRIGNCRIYPVCAKEIDLAQLPPPLGRLQALSLAKAGDLKMLFESLVQQFGFGNLKDFKASGIMARIPKYSTIKMAPEDSDSRTFYHGKYSGYNDEELQDVLVTYYINEQVRRWERSRFEREYESNVLGGRLVHYRQVDRELDLPAGTSSRLLILAAESAGLVVAAQSANTVRFGIGGSLAKRLTLE